MDASSEQKSWVRWALLIVGGAFALAMPASLLRGDGANAIAQAVLAAAGIGGFFVISGAQEERVRFARWLVDSRDDLIAGRAFYDGTPVTLDTAVHTYDVAVSLLIVSSRFSTRPVLSSSHERKGVCVRATLVSILFGWWGFPFGPIYTIGALYKNLNGGSTTTLGELLDVRAPRARRRNVTVWVRGQEEPTEVPAPPPQPAAPPPATPRPKKVVQRRATEPRRGASGIEAFLDRK